MLKFFPNINPMAISTKELVTIKLWYFTRRRVVDFARATTSSC